MSSSGADKLPTVSVLMPVHNGGDYLHESVSSILAQTVSNLEFIIIDDGSTDESLAILRSFAARDSRIRVVSREQRGLISTLNEGIDLAQGEWIARMDADDVALPDRLARQLDQLSKTGADFCGGAVECFGSWNSVWRYPESHLACEATILFHTPFAHPALVARRVALLAVRYDNQCLHAEDYDCWQRAWAAGYKLTNVPAIVLRYRMHDRQISSKHRDQSRATADRVRRRHWTALAPELTSGAIEEVLAVIGHNRGRTAELVPVFQKLLSRYDGEARQTLLFNIYRTFCGVAGKDKRAPYSWWILIVSSGPAVNYRNLMRLMVLASISLLHLNSGGVWFRRAQRLRAAVVAMLRGRSS